MSAVEDYIEVRKDIASWFTSAEGAGILGQIQDLTQVKIIVQSIPESKLVVQSGNDKDAELAIALLKKNIDSRKGLHLHGSKSYASDEKRFGENTKDIKHHEKVLDDILSISKDSFLKLVGTEEQWNKFQHQKSKGVLPAWYRSFLSKKVGSGYSSLDSNHSAFKSAISNNSTEKYTKRSQENKAKVEEHENGASVSPESQALRSTSHSETKKPYSLLDELYQAQQAQIAAKQTSIFPERRYGERGNGKKMKEPFDYHVGTTKWKDGSQAKANFAEGNVEKKGRKNTGDKPNRNIKMMEKRIAEDGNSYTREEFITYFGGTEEWERAPTAKSADSTNKKNREKAERRVAMDRKCYTKEEFIAYYGGTREWEKARPIGQTTYEEETIDDGAETRIAEDGQCYTKEEFIAYYGGTKEWERASCSLKANQLCKDLKSDLSSRVESCKLSE